MAINLDANQYRALIDINVQNDDILTYKKIGTLLSEGLPQDCVEYAIIWRAVNADVSSKRQIAAVIITLSVLGFCDASQNLDFYGNLKIILSISCLFGALAYLLQAQNAYQNHAISSNEKRRLCEALRQEMTQLGSECGHSLIDKLGRL